MKFPSQDGDAGLASLTTESANPVAAGLDARSALEIARIMNSEDRKVPEAVGRALPAIARSIDVIAESLKRNGRLIYVGAGTSGRIAALDASECPPTFGIDPERVQYLMAGGVKALGRAAEYNEDSRPAGRKDMAGRGPGRRDVVVGVAASGRTPYTIAAVEYARRRGAMTIAVVCNGNSELGRTAEIEIVAEVGPEVVSGSTRLKAGTAQKLILNMLTTGAMSRLGYVYGNLMVNVSMRNQKLNARAAMVLERAAGADSKTARETLAQAGQSVPVALVMLKTGATRAKAESRLKQAKGNVRQAIEMK
ncbi:MAG: N-acetylmuramic acid 6-phosphate etherase [Acidobacteria bacterium]|nr:N-acetylmuramic acid 6-phosphate etherase [Acidobacteriota bacterium]